MSAFKRYEEIFAWEKGRELVKGIYLLAMNSALKWDYGLKDQIQRAAVSICSNIAEGFERRGNKEFVNFLWIAKGSSAEVSSQLYHLRDLELIDDKQFQELYELCKLIGASIYKLIAAISVSDKTLSYKKPVRT